MPKSNRLLFFTVGGLTAVFLFTGALLILQPGGLSSCYAGSKTNAKASNWQPAYEGNVTCNADCQVRFALGNDPHTPDGREQANEPASKQDPGADNLEQRDLIAQCRMAYWAIVLAGLTAAGIVLLAGTFWEAMEATKAANSAAIAAGETTAETRRIGEAQVRAYLSCAPGGAVWITATEAIFDVRIHNSGNSPAKDVKFYPVRRIEQIYRNGRFDFMRAHISACRDIAAQTQEPIQIRLPIPLADWLPHDLMIGQATIFVLGNLRYTDVFNRRHKVRISARGTVDDADELTGPVEPLDPNIWKRR